MNRITIHSVLIGGALCMLSPAFGQTAGSAPAATPAKPPAATAPVPSQITAPPDPNRVVLSFGDEKMTAAQYEALVKDFPPQLQQIANGPQKRSFIEQYVSVMVMAQEAEHRKLDQNPEIKQQIALQRDQVLAQNLYQSLMNSIAISPADIEKYYNDHKSEFETVKAHHILIAVKGSRATAKDKPELTDEQALAKAKEVQKRLLAGEDFAKVANETSYDPTHDGDLGTFPRGQMVPEFDKAVFSLPIGKVSDPIKTEFGYHIIRVDSRETKTLAEVKPEIEKKIRPEMAKKEVDAIREKANVHIDDTFFPPQPTPNNAKLR